jgi:hypothetical protein
MTHEAMLQSISQFRSSTNLAVAPRLVQLQRCSFLPVPTAKRTASSARATHPQATTTAADPANDAEPDLFIDRGRAWLVSTSLTNSAIRIP